MADISAPRIFFDTNEGSHERGYWLHLDQSKKDIAALMPPATEGMEVVIYMPDELEMCATLNRDKSGVWIAMPISGSIKHYGESKRLCRPIPIP